MTRCAMVHVVIFWPKEYQNRYRTSTSRRQLVRFFGQSAFRIFRQVFQRRFVVNTFVERFEMEIVQKSGLVADG